MKEIKIENIQTIIETRYEAIDGTVFMNKEECSKYEETAMCVLKERFNKLVVNKKYSEWDLFKAGNVDYTVLAVKMNSEEDKDVVLQLYFLQHQYLIKDYNKAHRAKLLKVVEQAFNEKDVLLLGVNYEDDLYYIDTRNNIINRLNNLDKEEEK